ncbi:DUF72 domain-containing protein [[Eubacterium] cellulosolvens]
MAEILLGTSGWSYAEWEETLYTRKQGKLTQYSSIFPTVEINSTFYALPKNEIVFGWTRHTPTNFKFSAKLPQTITHKKALDPSKGIESDLNLFLEVMKPLIDAGKLICILVQLPPFLKINIDRLESFLKLIPKQSLAFAVEFRHISWLQKDIFKLLEKYSAAYTIVDEPLLPPDAHITSDFAYFRWHGRGSKPWFNYRYSEEELEESVKRVNEVIKKTDRIIGYFNNHFHAYAPENCLQIMKMLGIETPKSSIALDRISSKRKGKPSTPSKTLEAWMGPLVDMTVENWLLKLTSADVIELAKSMPDKDFSLREDSRKRIAAYVAETTVDINFELYSITHYCPLWSKLSPEKKICPHVAKLLLSIEPEKAKAALVRINSTLDRWNFESRLSVDFPK